MQTKEQVMKRVKRMMENVNKNTLENVEFLLQSGAIDLNIYDDTYLLPKYYCVKV